MESRLSEAFPPNSEEGANRKFSAKVHEELEGVPEYRLDAIRKSLRFQSDYTGRHFRQLKDLHKEFFPIDYDEPFYDQIATGKLKLVNCIATIKNHDYVIGTIVYKLTDVRKDLLGYWDSFKLLFKKEQHSAHVYTLGVINEFRGKGVAKELFEAFKVDAISKYDVKCIYLDCATYNESAIKFYLKAGFSKVKYKNRYYRIFGNDYNAVELVHFLQEYQHYNSWLSSKEPPTL